MICPVVPFPVTLKRDFHKKVTQRNVGNATFFSVSQNPYVKIPYRNATQRIPFPKSAAEKNPKRTAPHVPHRNVPQVTLRLSKKNITWKFRNAKSAGVVAARRKQIELVSTFSLRCRTVPRGTVRCGFLEIGLASVALRCSNCGTLCGITLRCGFLETGHALRCGSVQYVAVRCVALPSCGNPAWMTRNLDFKVTV